MKKSSKDLKVKSHQDLTKTSKQDLQKQKVKSKSADIVLNKHDEAPQTKKFSIKPYLKQHKWGVFGYVMFTLIDILVTIPFAILPAETLVAVTEANYTLALTYVAIMGGLYCWITISNYFWPKLMTKLSTEITMAMSLAIAEQAFKISSSAYTNHQTSNFLQRIRSDPDTIFNRLTGIVENIGQLINVVVVIVYMLTINAWTSLILVVYLIAMMAITYFRKKARIKNQRKVYKANETVSSLLNEVVRSERDIKSLNLETRLKDITKSNFDEFKDVTLKAQNNNLKYRLFDWITFTIFFVTIMSAGIILLDKGFLTLATFLIIYNNRYKMDNFSNLVANIINNYADIKVSYERINELYADDDYALEKFGTVHRKNLGSDIEFKDVSFAYTEYKAFSQDEIEAKRKYNKKHKIKGKVPKREIIGKKQVFEDLSFKIEPNTTVAFVGKSGCGKSTVLNLISKIYTVDSGKVLIGGIDINKLDKSTLRSSISLVNQFPYIFDMTIKENLLLAKPDATDEEIAQVVKDAALEEFVAGLTSGLNTKVGESGMKLSGGQKQRLAIARALLKKSNVIILDESTSSLDNLAQNTIKESIDRIKGKSTIIIVAHRLSTIKNVDKIFFMENGKIVDTGTFAELNKNNKAFKKMYNAENIED